MKKEKVATKDVFCDSCRQDTQHKVENDRNAELLLTCQTCGSFIKLPGNLSEAEQNEQLAQYKAANSGKKEVVAEPTQDEDLVGDGVEGTPEETPQE